MIEIKDVLNLIGNELKDGKETTKRFREFIEQSKWSSEQIKNWLDECISNCSGPHDPYNRAFQDIIISLGKKLGFEIKYGKYHGKPQEENYDGLWIRQSGDIIVIETKISAWPIGSVNQLGYYIDLLGKKEENRNVFGLYIIGKGDVQPLTEQILGSKYKDKIRIIVYNDLMEIINLKEELEPVIGEKQAIEKIQNILLPIESVNIGNIVKLITEIATIKSTAIEEQIEKEQEEETPEEEPWSKEELLKYLENTTPYQRILLAALVQVDREPAPRRQVIFLMNEIAKRRPSEGIKAKITGRQIAGARGGLKLRRKPLKKEDIIESSWSSEERDYMYKIKDQYKQIITEWIKKENLWIK